MYRNKIAGVSLVLWIEKLMIFSLITFEVDLLRKTYHMYQSEVEMNEVTRHYININIITEASVCMIR